MSQNIEKIPLRVVRAQIDIFKLLILFNQPKYYLIYNNINILFIDDFLNDQNGWWVTFLQFNNWLLNYLMSIAGAGGLI